jgi:hypothetical protein
MTFCGCLLAGTHVRHTSASASAIQSSDYLVADPIFSASFVRSEAKFEWRDLRSDLARCPRALVAQYENDLRFFVFGDILSKEFGRIILVSKERRMLAEDDPGDAFILKGGSCAESTPNFILTQFSPFSSIPRSANRDLYFNLKLPDADVERLMVDTLNRHAAAFGGKKNFLKWLHSWYDLAVLPYFIPRRLGHVPHDPLLRFTPLMKSVLKAYEAN